MHNNPESTPLANGGEGLFSKPVLPLSLQRGPPNATKDMQPPRRLVAKLWFHHERRVACKRAARRRYLDRAAGRAGGHGGCDFRC